MSEESPCNYNGLRNIYVLEIQTNLSDSGDLYIYEEENEILDNLS